MSAIKPLGDYIIESRKADFEASKLKDCVCVPPKFKAFTEWQKVMREADPITGLDDTRDLWLAVAAVVRSADGKTQEFITQEDFDEGDALLHLAVGNAANKYLAEYLGLLKEEEKKT